MIVVDEDTREEKTLIDVIVKPDGWTIPEEVAAIHGITTEIALDVGIPEKQAVEMCLDAWRQSELRVGHNVSFDDRILRIALKRYFGDEIADEFKAGAHACTGLLAKPIMKMEPKNRYGYKMPKLTEAYRHFFGRELEGAHSAMADARASMDVFFHIKGMKAAAA